MSEPLTEAFRAAARERDEIACRIALRAVDRFPDDPDVRAFMRANQAATDALLACVGRGTTGGTDGRA